MGELFNSGIRAILNSAEAQTKLPCVNCEKKKLHSPFWCAHFYNQETGEFEIPFVKPLLTEKWIEQNEGSENGITFAEVERYKNHPLHHSTRQEIRWRKAEEMEAVLDQFDSIASLFLYPDHELRVRAGRIRNFCIRDLKSNKDSDKGVHECQHLLTHVTELKHAVDKSPPVQCRDGGMRCYQLAGGGYYGVAWHPYFEAYYISLKSRRM